MSSDATPPTAPPPGPKPVPLTAAPASGAKSVLKIAVPLVALFGVVFGVVFLYTNAPKPEEGKETKGKTEKDKVEKPPLRFFTDRRKWDPPKLIDRDQKDPELRVAYRDFPMLAPSAVAPPDPFQPWNYQLANRLFQGVYEQSTTARGTQFWFENPNPESVTLQLKYVSCTRCSSGKLAVIPADTTKNLLQHTAVSALPIGAFNGYGVLMTQPFAQLTQVQWTSYEFKDVPNLGTVTFKVPGAPTGDKWAQQWGILELGFRVNAGPGDPVDPITVGFAAAVDGTTRSSQHGFGIAFEVAHAFQVWPESINLGRMDDLSTDTTHELIAFSVTRGPGSEFNDLTLTKADCLPKGPNGVRDDAGFVEVTKIERVPDVELVDLNAQLVKERPLPGRVRGAYKITVVVHPKVGDKRMDIGEIDRALALTSGGAVQTVKIGGSVRGAVKLGGDRGDITLNEFKGKDGTKQEFDLFTDRADIELSLLKTESTPDIYGYELLPQPNRENQRHYKLRVTVPAGAQYGSKTGEVVLEVKGNGPTPQRVRFPVRGKGNL